MCLMGGIMIFIDTEVTKYDWLMVAVDVKRKKVTSIINNREELLKFYKEYKDELWIGYNINFFDKYVIQAILCQFNPYDITDFIINKERNGWEYSNLLNKFPLNVYDTLVKDKSLKRCEASMGVRIVESSVPFDIDRKLTDQEIEELREYCEFDVMNTIEVFLQDGFPMSPQDEYKSSLGIVKEFNFPMSFMSKTKAQLGALVLGARRREYDDEFDISSPHNVVLGKYEYIREWFLNKENHWYDKEVEGRKTKKKNELVVDVAGIPTTFAWGGVHASVSNKIIEGILVNCDFASLYPNIMVNYGLISRGVADPRKFVELLERRLQLKAQGDSREKSYKIAINGSYGQMGYENSALYDKKMANNVCVYGQLIALDLTEKLEQVSEVLSINTDGVLVRVDDISGIKKIEEIAKKVGERLNIGIDVELYQKLVVKDVNNYIMVDNKGKVKAKGAWVKYQNVFEYNHNIVSTAIRDYFVKGIPVEQTINSCDDLREFQIIANAGSKYRYAMHGQVRIREKVNRVFASKNERDQGIFKVHKNGTIAKIEGTPENCFIINSDIRGMKCPPKLNKQWYIDLAKRRVEIFVN